MLKVPFECKDGNDFPLPVMRHAEVEIVLSALVTVAHRPSMVAQADGINDVSNMYMVAANGAACGRLGHIQRDLTDSATSTTSD